MFITLPVVRGLLPGDNLLSPSTLYMFLVVVNWVVSFVSQLFFFINVLLVLFLCSKTLCKVRKPALLIGQHHTSHLLIKQNNHHNGQTNSFNVNVAKTKMAEMLATSDRENVFFLNVSLLCSGFTFCAYVTVIKL